MATPSELMAQRRCNRARVAEKVAVGAPKEQFPSLVCRPRLRLFAKTTPLSLDHETSKLVLEFLGAKELRPLCRSYAGAREKADFILVESHVTMAGDGTLEWDSAARTSLLAVRLQPEKDEFTCRICEGEVEVDTNSDGEPEGEHGGYASVMVARRSTFSFVKRIPRVPLKQAMKWRPMDDAYLCENCMEKVTHPDDFKSSGGPKATDVPRPKVSPSKRKC